MRTRFRIQLGFVSSFVTLDCATLTRGGSEAGQALDRDGIDLFPGCGRGRSGARGELTRQRVVGVEHRV